MRRYLAILALILFALAPASLSAQTAQLGPGYLYPDATLTPGAVFSDVTTDQVCASGYTTTVRDVTSAERSAVFTEYGLTNIPGAYEVDHFISLELGGDNELANLWPEPIADARQKDKVENFLHAQVCNGALDLPTAQSEIAGDWYAIYVTLPEAVGLPFSTPAAPLAIATVAPTSVSVPQTEPQPPVTSASPTGATARCNDGTYWFNPEHRGACSRHGGVAVFYQ